MSKESGCSRFSGSCSTAVLSALVPPCAAGSSLDSFQPFSSAVTVVTAPPTSFFAQSSAAGAADTDTAAAPRLTTSANDNPNAQHFFDFIVKPPEFKLFYPFSPVNTMPSVRYFWKNRNTINIGTAAITDIAIDSG